ncbi:MAG: hypothetical protein IPM29_27485 [Planctomycetes bacterium]|nr:hypothetical protein [Planctomycetota bacterium]
MRLILGPELPPDPNPLMDNPWNSPRVYFGAGIPNPSFGPDGVADTPDDHEITEVSMQIAGWENVSALGAFATDASSYSDADGNPIVVDPQDPATFSHMATTMRISFKVGQHMWRLDFRDTAPRRHRPVADASGHRAGRHPPVVRERTRRPERPCGAVGGPHRAVVGERPRGSAHRHGRRFPELPRNRREHDGRVCRRVRHPLVGRRLAELLDRLGCAVATAGARIPRAAARARVCSRTAGAMPHPQRPNDIGARG